MAATRKEEKCVDLGARYIFEPIAAETLATLTHQLVTSSMTLKGGSPKTRARLERPASCTKGSQFWCSASILSFCMTVCQPDCTDWWLYPILYFLFNF